MVGIHIVGFLDSIPLTVGGEPACPSHRGEGKVGTLHKPHTFKVRRGEGV